MAISAVNGMPDVVSITQTRNIDNYYYLFRYLDIKKSINII